MDLNAFKTFLEVAKTLHFAHAADNLFVSQSTVSARIRALEESLGTELFVRERSNIHLSQSGKALVPHAKSIMTLWGRARQEVGAPQGVLNTLVIGGLSGLWDITLQDWLTKIAVKVPQLAISADIFSATTLVQRIMNSTMDVAFLYDAPQGVNLISQPLKTIRLRLVSSKPLADVKDAMDDDFISVNWGMNFSVTFAARFPDVTKSKLSTGLGRIAFEYLKQCSGSAYLAEPAIVDAIANKELFYVPNAPVFERKAYGIYHKENEKADLVQRLISEL
ncbi:MAG: DNA-binding transcriptional LysR family regulator [Arenicella sp.]